MRNACKWNAMEELSSYGVSLCFLRNFQAIILSGIHRMAIYAEMINQMQALSRCTQETILWE